MTRMYAFCSRERCMTTALETMKGLVSQLMDVRYREGYSCACGDKAIWCLAERRSATD